MIPWGKACLFYNILTKVPGKAEWSGLSHLHIPESTCVIGRFNTPDYRSRSYRNPEVVMGRGCEVDHPYKETSFNNKKGKRVRENIVGRHTKITTVYYISWKKEFMSAHPMVLYPAVLISLAHSYLNQWVYHIQKLGECFYVGVW